MKTIREHLLTKLTCLLLSFSILLVSCSTNEDEIAIVETADQLTGEDFFNAIYFKRGDLASQIYKDDLESLSQSNNQFGEEAIQIQDIVFATLVANNPTFMSEFEAKIKSGDLRTIEEAVCSGGDEILETMKSIKDHQSLQGNATFQNLLLTMDDTTSYETIEDACLLYLVAVFAIAVYAAVYFWKVSPREANLGDEYSDTQLYKEQFIYSIYELQQ